MAMSSRRDSASSLFSSLKNRFATSPGSRRSPPSTYAALPGSASKAVWLDCDPGHDDAIALLLALHHPSLQLLGVSTVGGNAPGIATFTNAARLLAAYRASNDIPLYRGADEPLLKQARADPSIHGEDGLGGVQGLPAFNDPITQSRFSSVAEASPTGPEPGRVMLALATLIQERVASGKPRIHLAVTGPMTNIALFVKAFPHLLGGIEQIVCMAGAAGVKGNRGPLAEFNVLVDPEATKIVFDAPVKVVMAGLNVTHQAIFTAALHDRLLQGSAVVSPGGSPSALRRLISTAMTFFASTYASEFGFVNGPPVHDMLAVAYIIDPTLFDMPDPFGHRSSDASNVSTSAAPARTRPPRRYIVDVETLENSLACGATVVDFYGDRKVVHEGWGRGGRNVEVLEQVDLPALWDMFFGVVDRAEAQIVAHSSKGE